MGGDADGHAGDWFALSLADRASAVERVGRVGTLVQEAVEVAADALAPVRDAVAVQLLAARDKKSAKLAIKNALAPHRDSAALANALFVPAVLADLAGQLMVHAYEVPHGKETRQLSIGEGQDVRAFLAMGWQEALDYFRARGLVTERELDRLLKRRAKESAKARDLMLDRVQTRVYELLGDAIGEGATYPEFASALRDEAVGLGITVEDSSYLQTVFRTNVMDAYGAGRQRALQSPAVVAARPYRQIRTANDGRVRPEHEHADGVVFTADGPLANLRPPFGFNCFPGHTVVQGTFNTATRALYDGEIVEITTQHGRRLSVTPNHPVATVDGFVPAGTLREGHQLICYEAPVDVAHAPPQLAAIHEHHAPTPIEQVFGSIAHTGRALVHGRSPDDFYGDAVSFQGNVDVVWADRDLGGRLEPGIGERGDDVSFAAPDAPALVALGSYGHRRDALRPRTAPTHSVPSSGALPSNQSTVSLHARPLQEFRIGPAANLHVTRYQDPPNDAPRDAEFIRDLLLGLPGNVRGCHGVLVEGQALPPSGNAGSLEPPEEACVGNADVSAYRPSGFSGQVTLDQVVGVRRMPWRAHVYDLQSPYGWIVAEGIITTNCRCSVVSLATWDGEVVSEVPADLLTPGFGGL